MSEIDRWSTGEFVQLATGAAFFGCYHRIFPSALQESLLLEPRQCPVEGPVAGKEAGALPTLDFPGDAEPVELLHTLAAKVRCGGEDGPLDRYELARFSSHDGIIHRYMRICRVFDLPPENWSSRCVSFVG